VSNSLAGIYQWKYRRWNSADTTASVDGTLSSTVTWEADSNTELQFWGVYAETTGINAPYTLSFVRNGNTLSNFVVKIDLGLENGLAAYGVTIIHNPAILKMTSQPILIILKYGTD
jgi:hypothetical protein